MPLSTLAALGPVVVGLLVVYFPMVRKLVYDWGHDDNYSHGFLIVPIALYLVWERRDRLGAARPSPTLAGLALVLVSLAVLVAGELGAELFLTRVSLLGVLVGAVLFLYGWQYLRVLWFPIAFLLLMIPIPAIIFNQIAFPLQLLASRFGEVVLRMFDIPVLREGNVITLANTQLEVAEACSGIRSLISLLTLGIVYGYFTDTRFGVRFAIASATIPVAIVANGLRVAGTGMAAYYYGEQAAQGFFHEFSGWVIFVFSLAMVFLIHRAVLAIVPPPGVQGPATSPAPTEA
jgi:exosortase